MKLDARALVLLLLVGPMTTGVDVEGEGGWGNFQYGGCASQSYNVRAQSAAAAVRVKAPVGFTAEVDGSVAGGTVRSTADNVAVDRTGTSLRVLGGAARGGWQWTYGGADIGAAIAEAPPDSYLADGTALGGGPFVVPSLSGWAGVPRYAYAWGSYAAEPFLAPLNARPPLFVGVGHQDGWVDLRAGAGLGAMFRGTLKLHRYLQPGIDVRYIDTRNWNAALTLRFSLDAFDE